jgi:Na+/melibiose symporter-like transporter
MTALISFVDIVHAMKFQKSVPDDAEFEIINKKSLLSNESESMVVSQTPTVGFYLRKFTIRTNLIVMVCNWISISFSYYLLEFYMKYLPGDIFTNTYMFSIATFAGIVFSWALLTKMGLKKMLIMANLSICIGVIAIIGFGLESKNKWLLPTLLLLSAFGCA